MRITRWVRSIAIPMFALLAALPLTAQTYRGGIGGAVVDPQGETIANAKVDLISNATGATRETVTTSDGGYVFQDLQLGTYTLTITAPGFAKATLENISVNPSAVTPVDPKLSLSGNLQFRADLFNLFNIVNPGNPSTSITSSTFGQQTSAPTGISSGVPFNVQFAGKIIF